MYPVVTSNILDRRYYGTFIISGEGVEMAIFLILDHKEEVLSYELASTLSTGNRHR